MPRGSMAQTKAGARLANRAPGEARKHTVRKINTRAAGSERTHARLQLLLARQGAEFFRAQPPFLSTANSRSAKNIAKAARHTQVTLAAQRKKGQGHSGLSAAFQESTLMTRDNYNYRQTTRITHESCCPSLPTEQQWGQTTTTETPHADINRNTSEASRQQEQAH